MGLSVSTRDFRITLVNLRVFCIVFERNEGGRRKGEGAIPNGFVVMMSLALRRRHWSCNTVRIVDSTHAFRDVFAEDAVTSVSTCIVASGH